MDKYEGLHRRIEELRTSLQSVHEKFEVFCIQHQKILKLAHDHALIFFSNKDLEQDEISHIQK